MLNSILLSCLAPSRSGLRPCGARLFLSESAHRLACQVLKPQRSTRPSGLCQGGRCHDSFAVAIDPIPVAAPLPHVASHVVQAVAIVAGKEPTGEVPTNPSSPGLCLDGFVAHDACLSMLPGGYPAAQNFAGVRLGAAEDGFVNFAIRILRQHRAERAVGSHGTATVTDREVAAGETVFVFD